VLSAAAMTGVQLVNVHALGAKPCSKPRCKPSAREFLWEPTGLASLAVTVLTSMDQKTMKEVGIGGAPNSVSKTGATQLEKQASMGS